MAWAVRAIIGVCLTRGLFVFADLSGSREAIHFRHLHVHENDVKGFVTGQIHSFPSVISDRYAVAHRIEQADHDLLVYEIVFAH